MVLRMVRESTDAEMAGRLPPHAASVPHHGNTQMRLGMVTRVVLAAAVVSAMAAPVPAHAQFGKLLKKAKEKVAGDKDSSVATNSESATATSGSLRFGAPKFDENMIELTPSVVDRMLRGMAAEVRVAQASGAKGTKLNADIAAVDKEYDQLQSQHPSSEQSAWQDANYTIEQCIGDELQKRQEQNEGGMQARLMSDPVARQKMMELSQRAGVEMERGDTLAAKKTMAELQALSYPSIKEDSAAARKKCGTPAPKPAWMAREEALNERQSQLADQLRKLDGAARDTALYVTAQGNGGGVGTGGAGGGGNAPLTAVQYSLALERMIGWAAATEPGSKSGASYSRMAKYSATELDAMKAKEADVRKLTSELRGLNVWR